MFIVGRLSEVPSIHFLIVSLPVGRLAALPTDPFPTPKITPVYLQVFCTHARSAVLKALNSAIGSRGLRRRANNYCERSDFLNYYQGMSP